MSSFKLATICENGHVISSCEEKTFSYCPECGAPAISECPSCHAKIHGKEVFNGFVSTKPFTKPMYCHNCGDPYPWTQRIIDSAVEVLSLDEELNEEQRNVLKNAIPDLLMQTPKTPVAVARYKTFLSKAPKLVGNALYQVLIDVLSESVKRSLFPQQQQ